MSIYDEGLLPDTQPVSRSRPEAATGQAVEQSLNACAQPRAAPRVGCSALLGCFELVTKTCTMCLHFVVRFRNSNICVTVGKRLARVQPVSLLCTGSHGYIIPPAPI